MPEIAVHSKLAEIGRLPWNACFPGEPEGYDYLRAVERAELPGFDLFYVTVHEGGEIVAAAPGFVTDYALETTLTGGPRRVVAALSRCAPRLFRMRLACLGSPVTETASLGVRPSHASRRQALVAELFAGLAQAGAARGCRLQAVKDVPLDQPAADRAARTRRLSAMSSLPTAVLELAGIVDEEAYWSRLSAATRKDLRRKQKRGAAVAVERVRDLSPLAERIDELYAATRARGELAFETLSWRYFQAVLEEMGENAACFLYRVDGELIAFNLLLSGAGVVVDKYFCADARGRSYNLYFLSWLNNVRFALSRGADRLVAGQACYEPKLRLGCELRPTAVYFRYSFAPINAVLRLASRYLGLHPDTPDAHADARADGTRGRRPAPLPEHALI